MAVTVYVVQDHRRYNRDTGEYESAHDLSPAEEFGELRYLLTPTAAPWAAESILRDLRERLADFGEEDYLLLNGNPILIGLATAVAADLVGTVTFLQWSGKEQRYTPVSAQIFDVDPEPELG